MLILPALRRNPAGWLIDGAFRYTLQFEEQRLDEDVDRACRYEPDLNRTYLDMATHYAVAVMPARPRKPRDKARVENAVLIAERWIVAALRHHKFYSLAEANEAVADLLEKLNHRPFRKREGSRASLFSELDQPALQPLPSV